MNASVQRKWVKRDWIATFTHFVFGQSRI